ncbi:hypothetical protein [Nonomuraea jiangxiensis]|uniref:Uncharacterized protein n=1 Tax=Nonomuraea jiangxiensis TaxID=633440 RepID=A0A1G9EZG3_9ACTN|nr:hypothetical protein [Nonomuraea jiangxiensis]SDK81577.1 hypothetical protein SAMN05421869_11967 [Nonomuraea jiangxiensis]
MHAVLHVVAASVGCVLALAPALLPALLPATRPARRWPHVVMALGMAVGHLGGVFCSVAVPALLTAGWLCGSPSRRAETGHHIQDFVLTSLLLTLTTLSGPTLPGAAPGAAYGGGGSGHAHGGGSLATVALVIGLAWTCAGLIRMLPERGADRATLVQEMCSAGMAASMTFMAAPAF